MATKETSIVKPCPSYYGHHKCSLTTHLGTAHWNGKTGKDAEFWTDADVIFRLQERLENLLESNPGLVLT